MQSEIFPDSLLADGLSLLCKNDSAIEGAIAARREITLSLLGQFIAIIESFNPALSLVGSRTRHDLVLRHILDSLAPLGHFSRHCDIRYIADVGSGAGFPGIPLAIALPDTQLCLIERKGRRAAFLRHVQAALNLGNVTVEEAEMEKVKPGRFSLVTFRAFKPLEPKMFKKLSRLCEANGAMAAYKGRRIKTEAEIAALEQAVPALAGRWELLPCPVPMLDEERHLLLISG